jgi:hypothetical protein
MPKAPEGVTYHGPHPLNSEVPMGGFDKGEMKGGGDLREHNGCKFSGEHEPAGPGTAQVKGGGRKE